MIAHILGLVLTALACGLSLAGAKADELQFQRAFPGATRFDPVEGTPPAAKAWRGSEFAGYVFRTRDIAATAGYSGKPIDVAVGLDLAGRLTGAVIVEHHEPIFVIGVLDEDLQRFVAQFAGRDVRDPIQVSRTARGGGLDAISGATVSSIVLADGVLRAARAVARDRGIVSAGGIDIDSFAPAGWDALRAEGAIAHRRFSIGDLRRAAEEQGAALEPRMTDATAADDLFVDLYLALATPAQIGRNLLGDRAYDAAIAGRPAGDQLLFVGATGRYSFKGTSYRRSGRFDRFQIVQDDRTFVLAADQYVPIARLAAAGAPDLPETGLFVLAAGSGFDPARPWRFELLIASETGAAPAVLAAPYDLPARYRLGEPAAPADASGAAAAEPLWMTIWRARAVEIVMVLLAISGVTAIFVFQDALVRRKRFYRWVRMGFMAFTLLALGWYAGAQLSVLNVLTFGEALRTDFRWEIFLVDPLLFILWSFTAVGLLFHARGVFCGWLCPFGALQELTGRLGRLLRLPKFNPPFAVNERAWPLKYIIFLGLFALSLGSAGLTVKLAEIEPFKTATVMHFDRTWPFVAYAVAILVVCLFVERFFCRYLCPLGGALAIPARLRMFDWLKRHWQCGLQCHICETRCPVQAIDPNGKINPNECIQCLECQVLYYDDTICPPMVERRRRRESRLTQTLVERFTAAEAKGEGSGTP